jgi:hypothetical protein
MWTLDTWTRVMYDKMLTPQLSLLNSNLLVRAVRDDRKHLIPQHGAHKEDIWPIRSELCETPAHPEDVAVADFGRLRVRWDRIV